MFFIPKNIENFDLVIKKENEIYMSPTNFYFYFVFIPND